MATISATVGSTSLTLSDGAPFRVISLVGGGGAEIRRVTVQGPAQDGDTDTGFRLAPREMELTIGFAATTDTILDGYRDTLTTFFKPLTATPVGLRIVRDDGEIRQINCNVIGSVKIDLIPDYRLGHYHRATVRLRAPDPAWYELAPGTALFAGTVPNSTNWWLAGGLIGTAQVLMHGGTPAANEAWSYSGTVGTATGFTLMVRATEVTYLHSQMFMFDAPTLPLEYVARYGVAGTETWGTSFPYGMLGPHIAYFGGEMYAGTQNYFYNSNTADVTQETKWGNVDAGYIYLPSPSYIIGTTQVWRTNSWPGTVRLYALYSPALTPSQRNAVGVWMAGTAGTVNQVLSLAYEGDLPEYPVISLTGPISNPVVTNTVTGDTLDFTGITISAGSTYVIDTRYGIKSVTQGTTIKNAELADTSDLSTWHIAPSPIATGGTNTIAVYGTAIGTATSIQVVYYNRYMSF